MLRILEALGYSCKAPEFDVIKCFLIQKPLQECRDKHTISPVNASENLYLSSAKNIHILETPQRLKAS
jgi:hypothetical protein